MATATLSRAVSRAEVGDWAAAKALYQAALAEFESADALEGLARVSWWLGEIREALEHGERAFARLGHIERHADAAMLGVRLCIWYLTNLDNATAARGWLSRARHQAQRCGDPVVTGWTDLVAGYLADDPDESLRALERAAAAADISSDADLATMALADLGLWHVGAGDVDRGVAMLDEAMAASLAQPRSMLEVVVWASCDMLAACSLLDDLRRATDWCRAADRFMETYGCPFLHARCRAHYGRVLVAAGRWDEADAELGRAMSMTVDTGRGPLTEALTALAELRLRQGEPEAALRLVEGIDVTSWGAVTHAACLVSVGRADEARSLLHGTLAVLDHSDPAVAALTAALVDADLATGHLDEASALVGPAAPVWSVTAFPRGAGLLARAAGLVACAHGDEAAGRAQLAVALDLFARLDLPFEAARTELDLARLLAPSNPEAAVARAGYALRRMRALGARNAAGEAAAFLRSLGVTPPPGPRTRDTLTAREDEVLVLVAQGLTNPQIAERLYLSPRTVGNHVSSILRKLGLRSRSEAAAFAAYTSPRSGRTDAPSAG